MTLTEQMVNEDASSAYDEWAEAFESGFDAVCRQLVVVFPSALRDAIILGTVVSMHACHVFKDGFADRISFPPSRVSPLIISCPRLLLISRLRVRTAKR